jgi:hypothetical protein
VARQTLYRQAQERHPARWSGATRDWLLVDSATLDSECADLVKMAAWVQHAQLKLRDTGDNYLDTRQSHPLKRKSEHIMPLFMTQ